MQDLHVSKVAKVTEESARSLGKGERVSPEEPLEGDNGECCQSEEEKMKGILSPSETGIKVSETGNHDPYQGGTCENPRNITGRKGCDLGVIIAVSDDDVGTLRRDDGGAGGGAVRCPQDTVSDVDHGS